MVGLYIHVLHAVHKNHRPLFSHYAYHQSLVGLALQLLQGVLLALGTSAAACLTICRLTAQAVSSTNFQLCNG